MLPAHRTFMSTRPILFPCTRPFRSHYRFFRGYGSILFVLLRSGFGFCLAGCQAALRVGSSSMRSGCALKVGIYINLLFVVFCFSFADFEVSGNE
ncbi:hypothetical protein DFH11DRAFT_1647131 [Phellopilus nigrolimitatus]|nr:hypothetical protein DFH11DRAFT_1647131 [Phellopilus nigrolimitatus]